MSDLNSEPSLIDDKMEVSINTVTEKEDTIKTNDNEEANENHTTKSMDFTSEVIKETEVKLLEISEQTNTDTSNEINVSTSVSEVQMETLNKQFVDSENKSEKQIEKDNCILLSNSISIDNKVIALDKNEFDNECSKNKENNYSSVIESENSTKTENSNNTSDLYFIDNRSSLDAIALEYDSSDPENDNENENKSKNDSTMQISNSNVYRNIDETVVTDNDSSDSESDSSSSESESDSNNDRCDSSSGDSDDEKPKNNKGNKSTKVFKPKSEFDDLPPIEDLKISVPEVLCDPLGEVAWTVEQMVVVRPKPGKPTLNLDTVLFIEKGQRALGHIFDVFGQVAEPHYCVRFNSSDHIRECDITVGMPVYYCPNTPYTSLVFLSELTKMKAVDDLGDDEPPQFSDDEEEQAYLASLKNKQNNRKVQDSSETPNKRKRVNKTGWQSNHPWNSNKDHQQNIQPQNPRPFYRTHHPWSRPRNQPQNQWHPYNFYQNQWMGQYPPYNQTQAYNPYFTPAQAHPQGQWNPRYQLPQANSLPLQGVPPTLVPPFNLPPPPPPPPPST